MSPDFREEPTVTKESCLAFIRSLMSRDMKKKELLGIESLINKYGPDEIQGQAADLMFEAAQVMTEKKKVTIDKYLKKYSSVYPTIHTWMARRIERQSQNRSEDAKAAERVIFQIINSTNGQSASSIAASVRLLDTISKN